MADEAPERDLAFVDGHWIDRNQPDGPAAKALADAQQERDANNVRIADLERLKADGPNDDDPVVVPPKAESSKSSKSKRGN